MNRIIKPARLLAMALVVLAISAIYIVTLYKLQVVEGEAYYAASHDNVVSTDRVPGARGSLMDRYGRVLVENKECNNILLDNEDLFYTEGVDPNASILSLVKLIREFGDSHIDTLPITKEAPFEYTSMTAAQTTMLKAYLNDKGLPESTSAIELLAYMRQRYDIDNSYSSEEMRIIAGVRYEINARYSKGFNTADYIFVEDASMDLITTLMENDIPGFRVETGFVREYKTTYAAHLLGMVGQIFNEEYDRLSKIGDYDMDALVGKDGAEYAFEGYLHGESGTARVTQTAEGIVTSRVYTEVPEPGDHVYLTIDIGLQEVCENALNSHCTEQNIIREANRKQYELYGGDEETLNKENISGAGAVVVNVKTGEPLALASWPSFDLSRFYEDYEEILETENDPLFNRALMGTYAPGSTFKPLTAMAGLMEKKIDTDTLIECVGVFDKYEEEGYAPQCWIYGKGLHGKLNVTEALGHSCNLFFYTTGDLLQISAMAKYATLFGLGESTGIELTEDKGVMSTDALFQKRYGRDMYAGDTLQAAIGQSESLFSPLQLAEYAAMIANKGTRHSASILKSVRSFDFSETVYEHESAVLSELDAPEYYWEAIHEGMRGVATQAKYGSVYEAFLTAPYSVAAKTGTSQLGENRTNNGIFICFAPYDDPEIAVAIVLEHGNAGSEAAPIARQIMDYYFTFKDSTAALESDSTLLR
ncbi:MAG: hypothetical protein IKV79_01915 [Oscillospiraceae bacterium]|nr:hypothetical protein [Oscillospiraceae bacterium]